MSEPTKNNTFCVLPFINLSVSSDGAARICCNNKDLGEKKFPFLQNITATNNEHPLNSSFHKELRLALTSGVQHSSCNRCWEVEAGGGFSYRNIFNLTYEKRVTADILPNLKADGALENPKYFYFDLALGNNCNLRCRMCNPNSSSQWVKDERELNVWGYSPVELETFNQLNWFESKAADLFLTEHLKYADRLNFLGGEPLLIKEHFKLLERCIELGFAQNISLQYNSNLTTLPESLKNLWSQFKRVEVNLSCDGLKNLNEFIRFPMRWEKWLENVIKICSWRKEINLTLSFHSTFQSLNVTQLSDFYFWCWNFADQYQLPRLPFVIYVSQPSYLDPRHMPGELKQLVLSEHLKFFDFLKDKSLTPIESERLSMIRGHLATFTHPTLHSQGLWNRFKENTKKIDRSRGQNILEIIPEFKDYLS